MKKRRVSVILAMIFLFTFSGCTPEEKQKEVFSENGNTITVEDVAGRTITLKAPVERIAVEWSGCTGPFMTMAALDKEHFLDKIVALDSNMQTYRKDMWDQFTKDMPKIKDIPSIGEVQSKEFNVEKLISLKPEVFIVPLDLKADLEGTIEEQLKKVGTQIVYIDFYTIDEVNHKKSTEIIGKIMDREKEAQELNDFYEKQIKLVYDRLQNIEKKKPTVYFEVGMKGPEEYYNSHGSKYMYGRIMDLAKGDSLSKDIEKSQPVSPELLLASDPDIIVVAGSYWPNNPTSMKMGFSTSQEEANNALEAFTHRKGWNNLKAVKNKQVYSIYFGLNGEMYDFVVLQNFAKIFYPDEFKDVEPYKNLQEYYEKYLPFELTGTWFTKIK